MYFLTPMCFICLKSKSNLTVSTIEILTKLIYCVGKIEDFTPLPNQTKICNDCLSKLNTTFDFKKMCLININQFKDYIRQLEQFSNNFNRHKVLTVELTDVNELKRALENNEFGGFNSEYYSDEQLKAVFIKKEVLNDVYSENYKNDEPKNLDEEVKLLSQTEELVQNKKQMQSTKVYTNESADLLKELLDEQVRKVFVKDEILKIKSEKQYSDEELKLLLHKEEILDDDYDKLENVQFHGNTYGCYNCQKCFKSKKLLKEHMPSHSSERPHSCSVCKKSFTRKSNLNRHILIHANERLYSCSVCKKNFIQKSYLKRHILVHINERPHSCPVCNKTYIQKNDLKNHKLIHGNERPHSCSECKKAFSRKNVLKRHMVIHTNEKLYSCSTCRKGFRLKGALTRHMFIHTKNRPYSCSVCKKGFIQKSDLRRHMLVYTQERLHHCSVCKKSFTRKDILKAHLLKSKHTNE